MSLNKVMLQGRLVADPELNQTNSGTEVTSFRIAVDRDFKNKETNEREADFISVTAWRGAARFVCQYFQKGSMIVLAGRLQVRRYEDARGDTRYATEVVAENVYFGGGKHDNEANNDRNASLDSQGFRPGPVGNFQDLGPASDNEELPF